MRPPEFTGGNTAATAQKITKDLGASMRPPEFTGGNARVGGAENVQRMRASMRPPEFTGGNRWTLAEGEFALDKLQ